MKPFLLFYGTATALTLAGCMVGPDYSKPDAPAPASYKGAEVFHPAKPNDGQIRGKWWEAYHDPQLNALEERVDISNQNVLQYEALFREASATVKVARAGLFPTLTASPAFTYSQSASNGGKGGGAGSTSVSGSGGNMGGNGSSTSTVVGSVSSGGSGPKPFYDLPMQLSYLIDVWGSVRRQVEANTNNAQASFADLENARLSYQSTLAEDYFSLRGLDAEKQLLEATLKSYQTFVELTTNRYNSGIASKADIAQAQAQLEATRVQLLDLGVTRAQYEDAIATLVGRPAPGFSLANQPLDLAPPQIPVAVPSTLLERRPDIAAAERRVASANATIGVNVAAYFPSITLTGTAGLESVKFSELFSGPAFFWSAGATVAQTVFDAGRIHGQVQEAQASYDATVATYRETVLTAFQQVQDNLSGLHILGSEITSEDAAVKAAQESLDISTNQYKAGTLDYLQVITTQAIALGDQVNAVNLRTRQMLTSVLLIQALGGGWDAHEVPGKAGVADVPEAQADIKKKKE